MPTLRKITKPLPTQAEEPVVLVDVIEEKPAIRSTAVVEIPDKGLVAKYIGRKIGGKTDFEIFDYAQLNNLNVLIEGPTGDGKTTAAMAYAAKNDLPFYSIPCNVGIDPSQLFGRWTFIDGVPEWTDGGLTYLVRHGGVLLINEINAMPPKVAMALFSLLDHRRCITLMEHQGEVIHAHPDLLIMADMNPGYSGTVALNAALRNRFPIQLSWDYSSTVENRLIQTRTIRTEIGNGIRKQWREGKIFTPVSTNMMMEFEAIVMTLGLDFAIENFVNHFDSDERAAVELVFKTFKDNLAADFASLKDQGPANPAGDTIVFDGDDSWIYMQPGEGA